MPRKLSAAIRRLSKQTFDVTRRLEGSFVKGRYVAQSSTTVIPGVRGSVQPITEKQISLLDVGIRERAKFTFWSEEVLQIDRDPDRLDYDGSTYELVGFKDWKYAGDFYAYAMIKIEGEVAP